MVKERRIPIAIGLALTVFILWLQFTSLPLARQAVQRLDYLAYDLRLKATLGEKSVDPRVVIVDIDEKSLKEEGHWPWQRDRIALLVDKLFAGGAKVVAFDMVFAEAERNSAQAVLSRLSNRAERESVERVLSSHMKEFDNNALLARHLANRNVVLGFILHPRKESPAGKLPHPLAFDNPEIVAQTSLPKSPSYTGNIDALHAGSPYGGFFTILPDSDGIYRRAPMLQRFGDEVYPSLSLEAVRLFVGAEKLHLRTAQMGEARVVEAIEIGDREVLTDPITRAMIPFRGEQRSFPYVSAADVLHDRVTDAPFTDRIVLVGTTAQGLFDLRATPVGSIYPGVEVHANLIVGMLDNAFTVEPSWSTGANFLATLCVGLLLALLLPRFSYATMVMAAIGVGAVVVSLNLWLWSHHGWNLSTVPPLLLVGTISPFNFAYGFWKEARDRRRLKAMFGQYVPKPLVEEMNRHPEESYGFEGESRDMSVLFCDIRGFTAIAEQLSAAQLKEMLNQFFTPMTRVIFEHRGTIDKYVGDMVMAFWGAPVDDPAHAEHAVSAALAMLQEAERVSAGFVARGLPPIAIGIGINTGVMNVGDMGSEYRRAYTVIGDSVNLASRLESSTRYYRAGAVIGEETYRRIADAFICRELDRVRVKGKQTANTVYEPICRRETATPELIAELKHYTAALTAFRSRQWDAADAAFATLQTAHPNVHIYTLYRERITSLRTEDPGEEWDGVYERTSK